jgi:hypothetical protein
MHASAVRVLVRCLRGPLVPRAQPHKMGQSDPPGDLRSSDALQWRPAAIDMTAAGTRFA